MMKGILMLSHLRYKFILKSVIKFIWRFTKPILNHHVKISIKLREGIWTLKGKNKQKILQREFFLSEVNNRDNNSSYWGEQWHILSTYCSILMVLASRINWLFTLLSSSAFLDFGSTINGPAIPIDLCVPRCEWYQ